MEPTAYGSERGSFTRWNGRPKFCRNGADRLWVGTLGTLCAYSLGVPASVAAMEPTAYGSERAIVLKVLGRRSHNAAMEPTAYGSERAIVLKVLGRRSHNAAMEPTAYGSERACISTPPPSGTCRR